MTKTNGGLLAAVFAAGMAAGGSGVEALRDPDPTSYVAAGVVEVITAPCETVNQPQACESLRTWQLVQLIDDLREDVQPGETFALGDLSLYVANRMTYDDPVKELWIEDALVILNRRLADGYVKNDISPTDTLSGEALVAMLEAARDA